VGSWREQLVDDLPEFVEVGLGGRHDVLWLAESTVRLPLGGLGVGLGSDEGCNGLALTASPSAWVARCSAIRSRPPLGFG
jgi:hypothetical protein